LCIEFSEYYLRRYSNTSLFSGQCLKFFVLDNSSVPILHDFGKSSPPKSARQCDNHLPQPTCLLDHTVGGQSWEGFMNENDLSVAPSHSEAGFTEPVSAPNMICSSRFPIRKLGR
jgi:hypothetical protein